MNPSYFEPNPCHDYKSSGFDQFQPPQYFDVHQPSKEISIDELKIMMQSYFERMNQQREQEALLAAQREQELIAQKQAAQEKEETPQSSNFRQLIREIYGTKVCEEQKQNIEDTMLELLEVCRQKKLYCMDNDVDDLIESALNSKLLSINLKSQRLVKEKQEVKNIVEQATKCRTQMKSDEVIKSSVKNLVPIPSEPDVTSDNERDDDKSLSNEDVPMENFKIYSNSLFDDKEIISTKIDPHHFNFESNLIESLLNRDTLIDSSPKFDYLLEEFSGELSHIDPIPPGIEEVDFDLEEEIRLVENLFDSQIEEIDLFLDTDDLMPPSIENGDYDSEGDIHFLEEFLSDDLFPLPKNESSNFDHHHDLLFPRPPPELPDVKVFFDFEIDIGVLTAKVVEDIYVLLPKVLPTQPTLCLNFDTLLLFSSKHEV
nr:hypothetical protein [Tanacetum cinerariifolium]